jgi:hypothetical protein
MRILDNLRGEGVMDGTEPLDMDTTLEVEKIIDRLERVVTRLKHLGSNLLVFESPSLEALEHLPPGTLFPEPGSHPFSRCGLRQTPIALDLEEAGTECGYCATRLDEILKKWMDAPERRPEED